MKKRNLLLALGAGVATFFYLHDPDKPEGNYSRIATLPGGKLYQNMDSGDVVFVAQGYDVPAFVRNVPLERGWKVALVEGDVIHWTNIGTGAEHGQRYDWTLSASGEIVHEGYV